MTKVWHRNSGEASNASQLMRTAAVQSGRCYEPVSIDHELMVIFES